MSVIIPAYKAAGTICRAIDSILAQTVPGAEIIVIDDGSPDDVAGVVERKYGQRVVLVRQPNGGAASARNAGIERATRNFMAFLDADDCWEPEKLERQLEVFRRHPEVGLVAGRFFEQAPGGPKSISDEADLDWFDRVQVVAGARAFRVATIVWTGTVLVRRSVLRAERFVSGLEPAEDRDLWARLVAAHPCYLLSEPLATAVLEPGSLSRTNLNRDCSNMLRVIARHQEAMGVVASRKWRAITYFRWSADRGNPVDSLRMLIRSFLNWPLSLRELAVPSWPKWFRLRRLALLCLIGLGLRPDRRPNEITRSQIAC